MALAKSIIAQLRRLERALNQALLRLQDTSDVEALHDVRINLQRIRSLLPTWEKSLRRYAIWKC